MKSYVVYSFIEQEGGLQFEGEVYIGFVYRDIRSLVGRQKVIRVFRVVGLWGLGRACSWIREGIKEEVKFAVGQEEGGRKVF